MIYFTNIPSVSKNSDACASMIALEEGRCVHVQTCADKVIWSLRSLWGVAWLTFTYHVGAWRMPSQDVITWTAILGGSS
jgi:hypothetical protein